MSARSASGNPRSCCVTGPQCHTLLPVDRPFRRLVIAIGWLIAAAVLGLGGAGVVARADNFAGDQHRPELTWRYDQAMAPGIGQATEEARRIAEATDKLADAARSALVHLLAGQTSDVADDLARGNVWTADMTRRGTMVESLVADLPFLDSPQLVSSGTRARIEALHQIVGATRPLPEVWQQLEQATVPAVEVTAVLQAHDVTAFEASQAGVREDYEEALAILADALAKLDQVAAMRDRLAPVVDVATLTEWIDRNRAHDEALGELYQALLSTEGRVTDEVRAAIEKYDRAKALLPPDTRTLVVILGDIALGGVNQAAIAIETVRGTVGIAMTALD